MTFSIIVPIYNCIKDLPACAESILAQNWEDFELILVDDGATDGSGALCDTLAKTDARIRVIHKENGGASSARNVGIEAAKGEYLLFFDGDDTIEPDCLENLARIMGQKVELAVFGMAFDYYCKANLVRTDLLVYPREQTMTQQEIEESFKTLFQANALSSACNKCFRADIVKETGLRFREGMTLYEDLDFVLRFLRHTGEVYFVPQCWYHYRLKETAENLNKRIQDIHKLADNLEILRESILSFGTEAEEVFHSLCAQLLYRHFLFASYNKAQLQSAAEAFQTKVPMESRGLTGAEKEMVCLLEGKQYQKLKRWLTKKKWSRKLRRSAKRVLKALGLK